MNHITERIAGRSENTKSKLRMIPYDGSIEEKKELFYSYVMQLKYHMGQVLKMPKENKIKFITIYLYLKYIMQLDLNILPIDQFVIYVDHIRNWPKDMNEMEWSLAEIDKLLKTLLSMEYYDDEMDSVRSNYLKDFPNQDKMISLVP